MPEAVGITAMTGKTSASISDLGQVIALHRKASGLSRVGLADLAGVGKTALFDIEHGKTTVRFDTLRRVLDALNITLRLESPLMSQIAIQLERPKDDATG